MALSLRMAGECSCTLVAGCCCVAHALLLTARCVFSASYTPRTMFMLYKTPSKGFRYCLVICVTTIIVLAAKYHYLCPVRYTRVCVRARSFHISLVSTPTTRLTCPSRFPPRSSPDNSYERFGTMLHDLSCLLPTLTILYA